LRSAYIRSVIAVQAPSPGSSRAERRRTGAGAALADRFVAAQRMTPRVDAHTVRLFLTCHRGGGDGVVTVVAHQAIFNR
jgi:hypothetical protein